MRPSPYVRRRWLGREIRQLREEHDLTGEAVARAVQFPRQQLSALENGHIGPDIDLVSAICDYLAVGVNRRAAIMDAASDGWAAGWWTADAEGMGLRQAMYADLESGAKSIAEYAIALIPGLLQTSAYADARLRSEPSRHSDKFDPDIAVKARARRQRLLLANDGPQYEAVIDEIAIRRFAAEPWIVANQLRHIIDLCKTHPSITVRILPADASLRGHSAPRSAFSIYRYPCRHGSQAVAIDTLTKDLVHTHSEHVEPYLMLYGRLKAAALAPDPSLRLLHSIAEGLSPSKGVPA